VKKLFKEFVAWRLLLFLPVFFGILFLPFRKDSEFTNLWYYTEKYPIVENALIHPWANFDGIHYLAIASRGYINEGRFLPLYPLIINVVATPLTIFQAVNPPFGPAIFWASMIVSLLATFGALFYLRKLISLDYSQKITRNTLFFLLISPTAFFLACVYSEGLFLLLSVLALFFARKQKWVLAIIASIFLSVTRLSGVLIIFPLLWEFYELEIKNRKKTALVKKYLTMAGFGVIPILLLAYSYFNYLKWGDWLYFVNAHAQLGNSREVSGLVFPLVTLYRYLRIFLTVSLKHFEFWIAFLEIGALIYVIWSLILAIKEKIRPSYLIFALVMLILPVLSGTLSGFPRYILPIFPIFLAQSLWLQNKPKLVPFFVASSVILQAILLGLFSRGYYIS
jgi:hypothetical protein